MLRKSFMLNLILGTLCIFSFIITKTGNALPPTGSQLTPEWIQYNKQATEKNLPKLTYMVTCKEVTGQKQSKEPREITDNFLLNDIKACVYLRWRNVLGSPVSTFKIYDPRGVLFQEWERTFKLKKPRWNQWFPLFIKDAPTSKLPGKWTAEILMDGVLAARKEFVIGDANVQYKQITLGKDAPAVGVFPFIAKEERGKWFDMELPNFIAQMMTIDYPDYRVILPRTIYKEIAIPNEAKIEDFVNDTISSRVFDDLVANNNINLCIAGSALCRRRSSLSEPHSAYFDIFIIDVKSKAVVKQFRATWHSVRPYKDEKYLYILHACKSAYKTLMKKAKHDIEKILTKK